MEEIRILIIEDEEKMARMIKRGLEEEQFEVDMAFDGYSGKSMALSQNYNAIILDINLPGINGFEVCKEIRKSKTEVPILMLTALGLSENKIKGFDSGADDYIVKPFEFNELIARLRVFLKRSGNPSLNADKRLKILDLILDSDSKKVWRGDREIQLTAKEFNLLEYLLRNENRVISRVELSEKIWDINFDTGTNIVDVYINYLRRKVDKDFSKKLIHTITGMGYVLRSS